ncbi:MAG: hypothetical protein ABSF70_03580 [Terracidiphilus sp.]|jgi:hypothetical protein
MTEREEQKIVDPLHQEQAAPEDSSIGVPADDVPCSSVSAKRSAEERGEGLADDTDGRQQADRKDAPMDIHAPMGKVKSLKEFATHILIVTIGILIAFGLEGARESWREHVAVNELRESLRAELTDDQSQLASDLRQVRLCNAQLDKMIGEMPGLAKRPAELNRRVAELRPGFFNFTTTAWESALSSNTLSFMERKERDRWVSAYGGIEMYQKISLTGALPTFNDVITYFPSHRSYTNVAEEAEAERKLRALRNEFAILDAGLGRQISPDIKKALESK